MTSRLPKKHRITVLNISPIGAAILHSARSCPSIPFLLLGILLIAPSQVVAQTAGKLPVQTTSWTNRSAKIWTASAKNQPIPTHSSPSGGLPWRVPTPPSNDLDGLPLPAAKHVARENPTTRPTSAPGSPKQEISVQPMKFEPIGHQNEQVRSSSAIIENAHSSRVAREFRPVTNQPFREDLSSSTSVFEDPWGDGGSTGTRPDRNGLASVSAQSIDPFHDPFGDHSVHSLSEPTAEVESEPAKFELLPPEQEEAHSRFAIRSPSAMRTRSLIEQAANVGGKPVIGLRLNDPTVAFRSTPRLQLSAANDSILPSLSPPLLQQDATLGEVPEFQGYGDDSNNPPKPEDVKGNDTIPGLPDVDEPALPEGFLRDDVDELPDVPGMDRELPAPPADHENDGGTEDDGSEDDEDTEKKKARCGRIYNDQDCCEQDEQCRTAWDRLNSVSIADIDLNISPPIAPLAEDETEIEEKREKLRYAPARDWKTRSGSVVATGTLEDLKDGLVIIQTEDGGKQSIPLHQLGYDEMCFLSAWWGIPNQCLINPDQLAIRDWTMTTFTWKAAAVCHKTPFFEDVQLERYGHSAGPVLQPLVSGAHFFANVALLPYNAGVYPPTECHYVLGYYRPGGCAPWLVPAFPLSRRGAAFEAAGLLGLFTVF